MAAQGQGGSALVSATCLVITRDLFLGTVAVIAMLLFICGLALLHRRDESLEGSDLSRKLVRERSRLCFTPGTGDGTAGPDNSLEPIAFGGGSIQSPDRSVVVTVLLRLGRTQWLQAHCWM